MTKALWASNEGEARSINLAPFGHRRRVILCLHPIYSSAHTENLIHALPVEFYNNCSSSPGGTGLDQHAGKAGIILTQRLALGAS